MITKVTLDYVIYNINFRGINIMSMKLLWIIVGLIIPVYAMPHNDLVYHHYKIDKCPEKWYESDEPIKSCFTVELKYSLYTDTTKSVNQNINQQILDIMSASIGEGRDDLTSPLTMIQIYEKEFFQALHHDMSAPKGEYIVDRHVLALDRQCKFLDKHKKYISVECNEWINTGGAHGMSSKRYLNINPQTGQEIKLLDLIKTKSQQDFIKFAEKEFYKKYPKEDSFYSFFGQGFSLPQEYLISEKNLYFHYGLYEAAPYAAGYLELVIPLSKVKHYMKQSKL